MRFDPGAFCDLVGISDAEVKFHHVLLLHHTELDQISYCAVRAKLIHNRQLKEQNVLMLF